MKKRINSIDIAKAIGIFLIVLGHVLKSGEFRKFIFAFHVPLFFFLSGICFLKKNNKEFIKRKIQSIYIPYIIISCISIIIYMILGKYINQDINGNWLSNIFGMFYANSNLDNMEWNQPLWFLPCLMILLIVINFIENLITKNKFKTWIRILVIAIALVVSIFCQNNNIFLPMQFETACNVMIFTYSGIIIKEISQKNINTIKGLSKNKKILYIVLLVVTILISIYLSLHNETISVRQNKYGNYLIYIVVSYIMIIITMIISIGLDRMIKNIRIITYIGKNTLIILLLHKFPILFFQNICPISKDILMQKENIGHNIFAIVITILVIALCLICNIIINKFKEGVLNYDRDKE